MRTFPVEGIVPERAKFETKSVNSAYFPACLFGPRAFAVKGSEFTELADSGNFPMCLNKLMTGTE